MNNHSKSQMFILMMTVVVSRMLIIFRYKYQQYNDMIIKVITLYTFKPKFGF